MARLSAVLASAAAISLAALVVPAVAANEVEGLVVVPGPGPTVRSTYPASDAKVRAGVLILKIEFDQPMAPGAWAYGRSAAGDFPDCLADPRLLADQRTYVLMCTVSPGHAYAIDINPAPRFASAYGRSAKAFTLKFATNADDDIVRSLHDALAQAGLADTDDPIMTWRDNGQGASQTAPPQ